MKSRALVFAALVAIPALALAATLLHAHGRGTARAEDGRIGHFNFEVNKRVDGENVTRRGTFVLECTDPEVRGAVRIYMRELHDLAVDGRVATFDGPGSIRFVRRNNTVVERRGRIDVRVRDTRRGGTGDPDRIAVRFTAVEPALTYGFEGNVRDGDVVVRAGDGR